MIVVDAEDGEAVTGAETTLVKVRASGASPYAKERVADAPAGRVWTREEMVSALPSLEVTAGAQTSRGRSDCHSVQAAAYCARRSAETVPAPVMVIVS